MGLPEKLLRGVAVAGALTLGAGEAGCRNQDAILDTAVSVDTADSVAGVLDPQNTDVSEEGPGELTVNSTEDFPQQELEDCYEGMRDGDERVPGLMIEDDGSAPELNQEGACDNPVRFEDAFIYEGDAGSVHAFFVVPGNTEDVSAELVIQGSAEGGTIRVGADFDPADLPQVADQSVLVDLCLVGLADDGECVAADVTPVTDELCIQYGFTLDSASTSAPSSDTGLGLDEVPCDAVYSVRIRP